MKRNHKGYRVGQDHHRAKISDATVAQMRAKYVPYVYSMGMLSREFRVPFATVRDIVTYRTRPL